MSAYTHIFLRKNDTFINISTTGRSSMISRYLEAYAPYEHIAKIEYSTIDTIINALAEYTDHLEDSLQHYEEQKNFIMQCNNSIEDKMEQIADLDYEVIDVKGELIEAQNTTFFFLKLRDLKMDGTTIYVGVECGDDPGIEDIVK